MKLNILKIKADVWVYPGKAGWFFVTLPKDQSEDINKTFGKLKKGWGSLPVRVILGKSKWETSIFPHKKSGGYLLPLKAQIRKIENVNKGDTIQFKLEILVSLD